MATVGDSMTRNPMTIELDGTVREAAQLMASGEIGDVVVMDDERVVGILTDRDIVVRVLAQGGGPDDPVGDVCTADPVVTTPDADTADAVRLMRENDVRRVLVVEDDGRLVGIVSLRDLTQSGDPASTHVAGGPSGG